MALKVKLQGNYRSSNGNTTFRYIVSGGEAELTSYKEAQGDFYRENDEGKPLWFTTRCIGNAGKLVITSKGKVVPDMSAYEQAASLSAQYGGNFGAELARASVANLIGATHASESMPGIPADEE